MSLSSLSPMEQYPHFSMWMKSNHLLNLHFQAKTMNPFFNNSREEQVFAHDVAAGPLGGFRWPPRSYSCSFCKREFRSAQALGGHMNVHRRDRARLKQSLSPHHEVLHHRNHRQLNASSNPSQEYLKEFPHSSTNHWSDSKTTFEKNARKEEFGYLGHDGCVETNLSMGLNLVTSHNQPFGFDEVITHKRHKTTISSVLKPCSNGIGLKGTTGSLEELDLELRLGEQPKVKRA